MKEAILHHWWKSKNIDFRKIHIDNQFVKIIDFGKYNAFENGPDFINAKVQIDELLWCGSVEMHIKSSDWIKHRHQLDTNYDNVILHVVYEKDCEVYNSKQELIPTIEVIPFQHSQLSTQWIPCENTLVTANSLTVINEIEHALLDRLNRKASLIQTNQMIYQYDYQAIFYLLLFRSFGNKVNVNAFEHLFVRSFPYLSKSIDQVEALLFGLSQLTIPKHLADSWDLLKHKFEIQQQKALNWKTKGFYAGSKPEKRISQLASVIQVFRAIDLYQMKVEDWLNVKKLILKDKILTAPQIDLILINAVSVFYWWLSETISDNQYKERALDLLMELPPEKNEIITKWQQRGIKAKNAFDTQGLLELKSQKCTFTKCLTCKIGKELL